MLTRRQYDRAFKLSAVECLAGSDLPLAQVARSLGIHESMLRRWRDQIRKKGAKAFSFVGRLEGTELEKLRRENRRLKQDLEALKKTLVLLERIGA